MTHLRFYKSEGWRARSHAQSFLVSKPASSASSGGLLATPFWAPYFERHTDSSEHVYRAGGQTGGFQEKQ